ncbi:MAG: MBL fold metallo-hydrolase [Candidatus Lokiarchaeota archaeon]|nr:MBL fold metallo-hydrolase [Candidatus Lokiarchaeota archaeon]MBD3342652.1 MBL fold metallo-hydrolase [Candidatus Lokiarchaeota archaeon]
MILHKLILGAFGTNCYVFGSSKTNEVVVIDPGAEPEQIIKLIEKLNAKPIAVLLTHGHVDHSTKVGKIMRTYDIPLIYNKKEYDSGVFTLKKASRWIKEGDSIQIGEIVLHVIETPGHSPGSVSYYTTNVKELDNQEIDGIIFTGDLLFRRSVGRSDLQGGDQNILFSSIKNKIMNNPDITDSFVVFPGHMGKTTVGEERSQNMFRNYFM